MNPQAVAESIQSLMSMGFDENQARKAYESCNGNLERAIDFLLDGGGNDNGNGNDGAGAGADNTGDQQKQKNTPTKMIVTDISQYSIDKGKSACTCIALTMAVSFLTQIQSQDVQNTASASATSVVDKVVTADFLRKNIMDGIETYRQLVSCNTQMVEVEHMSAEEILEDEASPKFTSLELLGGYVRQGVLSTPGMDLQSMIHGCITEHYQNQQSQQEWMTILITKTPETIVICIPPAPSSSQQQSQPQNYILLDSHPRPQLFGDHHDHNSGGAYGRIYTTLDMLLETLTMIFPSTELGSDIPETMSMMYNSFDLYPLVLKK